ncbi:hypothetical protein Tco_1577074 [Tanacetum coccineum]
MEAVEVPQTLEYKDGQLNAGPVLEVENFTNWKKAKSTWDDLILYHKGPFDVKESKVMDLRLCYNTFKFKEDSPDDEEDTRSSHKYLNDLEEEYQARVLLARSKRPTQDFEAKYNKVKAKLALLSSSALASKAATIKNRGLIAEAYEWDEEEVSSDDNEMVEVKVLVALVKKMMLSAKKVSKMVNGILPAESQRNTTDPPVVVTHSSTIDYDSADESSVYSTPLPPLKKLDSAEPVSGPNTIKSILRLKSTFNAETLKGVIINEPYSTPAGKLKSVKIKDDPPLAIVMKELNDLKLQISKNQSSYSRNNLPQQVPQNALQNKYKTQFKRSYDLCGLNNHLSENCYKVMFCKKCKRTDHRTCDHIEYIFTMNMSQHLNSLGRSSSGSKNLRPSKHFFPPCIYVTLGNPSGTWTMDAQVYIHNHKDHLGKFDEKADDGYLLGYSLVSKAFRVFNTRRQQTKETYHITFDESPDAIKFLKPSVDNINIAKNERYPPDEYLHPYEPS